MKIAVVHYHLEPGGVTRVIENTLDAFAQLPEQTKFVALSGRPYQGQKIQDVALVEGLDYICLLYTSPSPRDRQKSRMPSSA